jgi:hypothetical protein
MPAGGEKATIRREIDAAFGARLSLVFGEDSSV